MVHLRPSLDDTLLEVARVMSQRATCPRLKVGAVLAREGRILSTGYNGSPAGLPHCSDHSGESKCEDATHAEANSLIFAARHGVSTLGATMFCTHSPCLACSGLLINAGIAEVVYAKDYRLSDGLDRLRAAGITVRRLDVGS